MSKMFVADDNGFSDHKMAWLDAAGEIQTIKIPTVIAATSQMITDLSGNPVGGYELDGETFVCDVGVQSPVDLRNAGYQLSNFNKVLLNHGLWEAGFNGTQEIVLGTTLPMGECFGPDGKPRREYLMKVGLFFGGKQPVSMAHGRSQTIVGAKPYAEGLCSYFDWAIDDSCQIRPEVKLLRAPVAVIDIGGSTTDIITIMPNMAIDHSRTGTKKLGVLDAKARVRNALVKEFQSRSIDNANSDHGIPLWMVEEVFEKGMIVLPGATTSRVRLADEVRAHKKQVAEQITQYMMSTVGNLLSYQGVLFVGGGALVFKEALSELCPGAIFLDEFANARGALKYMYAFDSSRLSVAA